MYSKHYHCTECGKPHSKIMVDTAAEAIAETDGICVSCNVAELKADAYEKAHTYRPKSPEVQSVIHAETLGIGDVPMVPPLELVAQEPDVIEYNEHGTAVMKWEKHVDVTTGQRYYQDQKGNKWHYRKV